MKLNNKLIRRFNPCYDPKKYFKDSDKYSMIDLLKDKRIPARDRLWVCVRSELMSDLQLKYFGLECAKLSLKYTKDVSVKKCLNVISKYLKGKATIDDLKAARSTIKSTIESARFTAELERFVTESAVELARLVAASAWFAVESAGWSAAWSEEAWSAELAVRSAESEAARSAARLYADSIVRSARSAVEEKQCKVLIKILKTIK